ELVVGRPRHLDRPEGAQVVGYELRVEQTVVSGLEAGGKMHEGDLRSIARAVKHALAEEGAAEAYAVEAAHEFGALIHFDGMAVAAVVELTIEAADADVDPRPAPPWHRLCAAGN